MHLCPAPAEFREPYQARHWQSFLKVTTTALLGNSSHSHFAEAEAEVQRGSRPHSEFSFLLATNSHDFGGLKQWKCVLSQFWGQKSRIEVSQDHSPPPEALGRIYISFLPTAWPFLAGIGETISSLLGLLVAVSPLGPVAVCLLSLPPSSHSLLLFVYLCHLLLCLQSPPAPLLQRSM